jgi:DNA-binding response OmpR family regulator
LLVVGDEILRRAVKDQLARLGVFDLIAEAHSAASALGWVKDRRFDLIVLDSDLSDRASDDVSRALRDAGAEAPIIVLTGSAQGGTTANASAEAYIAKPFRMATLLTQVETLRREPRASGNSVYVIGPYRFQPAEKTLTNAANDTQIRLTEKEAAILQYLYRVGRQTVTRERLLDEVWGYQAGVTTHTLETHVYRLRQKIEPDPQQVQLLVTEPGGYRLNP